MNGSHQSAFVVQPISSVPSHAFDSASLEEWDIKTEVYNVGENNLTVDSILKGTFMPALNHENILSNTKVFERIEEMLYQDLKFPTYLQ